MPGKRFKAEDIVNKLRQADVKLARGSIVTAGCKLLGITDAKYFRWRKEYGRMKVDQAKRLAGAPAGERTTESAAGGRGARQGEPAGGRQGKLLSPARRQAAIEEVRRTLPEVSER